MAAEQEVKERTLANGMVVLGIATLIGLLPFTYSSWGSALLPLAAALTVLSLKPIGNRLMATGLASLSALLLIALWRFEVFFTMLVVLVAVILAVAGVLKHRGKW